MDIFPIFLKIGFWVGVLRGYKFGFSATHHLSSFFSFSLSPLEEIFFLTASSLCVGVVFACIGFLIAFFLVLLRSLTGKKISFLFTERTTGSAAVSIFLTLSLFRLKYLYLPILYLIPATVLFVLGIGGVIWYLLGRAASMEKIRKRGSLAAFVFVVSLLGATFAFDTYAFYTQESHKELSVFSKPTGQVLLIGIDGATWEVLQSLIEEGKVHNLAQLKREGASGILYSVEDIYSISPLVWTTIATGKHWSQHGIKGFLTQGVVVNSTMRKTKAIWNILSEREKRVGVIEWSVNWPVERVNGQNISERSHILYEKWERFFFRKQFKKSMRRFTDAPFDRRVDVEMESVYLRDRFVGWIGNLVLKVTRPDFLAIYFDGVDVCQHRYLYLRRDAWKRSNTSLEEAAGHFGSFVDQYYEYLDEMIGRLVEKLPEDATVIVVSDHGFDLNGSYSTWRGIPQADHAPEGIIIMTGRGIQRGRSIRGATVYDVFPTMLYLMETPLPRDIPGKILSAAFEKNFIKTHPVQSIPSYETGVPQESKTLKSFLDRETIKRLHSLGYLHE